MLLKSRERLAALTVFLLCVAAWSHIPSMPAEAALFPELILGLAAILTLAWGGSTFFPRSAGGGQKLQEVAPPFTENPRNLLLFVLCLVAYVGLIDILGYFTSTILFMAGSTLCLGFRRPAAISAAIVGFVGFVYIIFVVIFQRPLPIEFFQAY